MRLVKYPLNLGIKISEQQRSAIENIANREQRTLGDVARELMDTGLEARGL